MRKKKTSIQFQIDLNSLKTVGKITNGESDPKVDEINLQISKTLKNLFTKGFTEKWLPDFNSLIENNGHLDAYKLLEENKWALQFSKIPFLESLLRLDKTKLDKDQRQNFLLITIVVASKEISFGKVESEIELFLSEFGDSIAADMKQSVLLSKANAFAQNGKINGANNIYKEVIANDNTSAVDKAYAYRGLAKIVTSEEDIIQYHNLAADKFLEAGKKQETITDMVFVSKIYEKNNPKTALKLIDDAIQLYDSENTLDKEFKAGLHHRKAGYLFSLNKFKEALESIEIACELRENLIGNEYESYSSHSVAKTLCEKLNNTERALYHSNKIDLLSPSISGQEFDLQIQIQNAMGKKMKIENGLLAEIENSEFKLFKFSAYIFNATLDKSSFDKKLEWLDKAKLLLNEKDFYNTHYSLYYFTAAEVYRNAEKISDAIKNYELSLDYNLFHRESIQNCGAVLWKNKKWDKSLEFFKKRIDTLGESSTLCYALGRSYFELEQYQDAFNYFRKVSNDLDGVDIQKYITECLAKDKEIKLEQKESEPQRIIPISIESFKKTLEEFSQSISTNSRMYFWKNDSGKYKWDTKPEEKGKQFLITALEMKYGKDSIEIIQEQIAGAGIIDLYLTLRGGLKIVVELKICGGEGYSSTYAISGEDQLVHYLKNISTKIGFLIVFDGRSRDFGKGFKTVQSVNDLTIFTTAIEMKPTIK
jgi:tetratricopeptide (TPR) repeat protein